MQTDEQLTDIERTHYKALIEKNSEPFLESNGTKEEYQKYLGTVMKTPLGNVRMGANLYAKFIEKHRENLFIAARSTLENPAPIFTAENGSRVYVKSFSSDSGRFKTVISVTIKKDDTSIVITTHEERMNQILKKIKKTGILYEKAPDLRDGTVQNESVAENRIIADATPNS